MGNQNEKQKDPPISLITRQRNETNSPLMNWMETKQQHENRSSDHFRLPNQSLTQRLRFFPKQCTISFSKFPLRTIGAVIVVVATLASLYVYRPNRSEKKLHSNSEIHFDDVTIHPLNTTNSDASGWSGRDNNSLLSSPERQSSVSAAESEAKLPIQPDTFTIGKTSDEKQAAWLTGTIELDETSLSRSLPSPHRIGQRFEYFSQKRD